MTNDEFYYQFDAKLLRSHRLYLSISPILGQFFPGFQSVLWNGRYFSKYFIGHSAILEAGLALGIGSWIVPLLAVLALIPFGVFVRRAFGPRVAAAMLLLVAISPFYVLTGATTLSQPSVIFFFAGFLLFWESYRRSDSPVRRLSLALAMGLTAAAMGVIRPVSAAGLLLPILIVESLSLVRHRKKGFVLEAAAFAVPVILGVVLLLWVNYIQNGNPLRNAYALRGFPLDRLMTFTHSEDWRRLVENVGITLGRLNWAQFGWPISLAFLPFAFHSRTSRILGASALGLFLANHLTPSPGIDPVGPEHFAELAPLLALFTALGVVHLLDSMPGRASKIRWLLCTLVAFEVALFLPYRLRNLETYVRQANRVALLTERAGVHRAIVFASRVPYPWLSAIPDANGRRVFGWPRKAGEPEFNVELLRVKMSDNGAGFAEYGDDNLPVPSPDLSDDVLYLMDFGPADAMAIDRLPGRRPFVLVFVPPGRLELHALTRVSGGVAVEPQAVAFTSTTNPDLLGP